MCRAFTRLRMMRRAIVPRCLSLTLSDRFAAHAEPQRANCACARRIFQLSVSCARCEHTHQARAKTSHNFLCDVFFAKISRASAPSSFTKSKRSANFSTCYNSFSYSRDAFRLRRTRARILPQSVSSPSDCHSPKPDGRKIQHGFCNSRRIVD